MLNWKRQHQDWAPGILTQQVVLMAAADLASYMGWGAAAVLYAVSAGQVL